MCRSKFSQKINMLQRIYPTATATAMTKLRGVLTVHGWMKAIRGAAARKLSLPVVAAAATSTTSTKPKVLIALQDPGDVDTRANSATMLGVDTLRRYFQHTAEIHVVSCIPIGRCVWSLTCAQLRAHTVSLSLLSSQATRWASD